MAKPNHFHDLSARLAASPLAGSLPTQNVQPAAPVAVVASTPPVKASKAVKAAAAPAPVIEEGKVQVVFDLRGSQRKQLERLARDADMTTRAFILSALAAKGLDVAESDLIDRRKTRR